MTLTELLEQIRIGLPPEVTNATDAMLTKMVNQIYHEVADAYQWPWLETSATINVVDGTQSYNLPTGFKYVISVYETSDDDRALVQQSPSWYFEKYTGDVDEEADAEFFFIYDEKIWFYPVPSTTTTAKYTMKYYGGITELSAGSDEPVFAEGFHYIFVHGVAQRLYNQAGQSQMASTAYTMYWDYLERMRHHYNRRRGATPMIWGDGNRVRRYRDPNLPILDTGA